MYHIRTIKTSSKASAIQVVRYVNRKRVIVVHIGSAHTAEELLSLRQAATVWIEKTTKQKQLLLDSKPSDSLLPIDKCQFLGIHYSFMHEVLNKLFTIFKYHLLQNPLLSDLVLMRIAEPASKLHSLELIEEYFGISHGRRDLYRWISKLPVLKDQVEAYVTAVAKKHFGFNFTMVFYDVTTLYFESFNSDELRKPGFSKDNKTAQPQIVIGLIVNTDGFPVSYEVFAGNKFEGHTLIPVITAFKKKHSIDSLTVVADAAMISADNIRELKANDLFYIVGARMGNLSKVTIVEISKTLNRRDGENLRTTTQNGTLVCSFSIKRYRKDKREMEKQLAKAEILLKDPSSMRRTKFIKNKSNRNFELNKALIEKTESLLGIKGYYTNMGNKVSNQTIINQYHNLWHVEQAFRIAKSDLEARPIYHRKEETIKAHLLICFMALAACKYMEIKTGQSVKSVIKGLKSVTDARILNKLTGKEIVLRTDIRQEIKSILQKLGVSH